MRRLWQWLFIVWRGWRYQKIGGQWFLVATRPLTAKGWEVARKDAAVSLPVMNAVERLFGGVTDGRLHFAEMAEAVLRERPRDRSTPGANDTRNGRVAQDA